MTFVASAYCLSPAVQKFWEDRVDGHVLWFGTTLEAVADYLEGLEAKAPAPPKPAPLPLPDDAPAPPSTAAGETPPATHS